MAGTIRQKNLPAATAPTAGDVMSLDGATMRGITIENFAKGLGGPSSLGAGYMTGAGGAVTQLTSRTTAVTLNKPCGAITLFAAAGVAATTNFQVANSFVAATDVIIVSVRSATNTYVVSVTAMTNGFFNIGFSAANGGTATDSPIFNFAIIKAVAS